jgi:NADP-dependent 3-hydroxy acid dehydrogenase YdfG
MTFADKLSVVTGASSGIGKAIALALASQGATVCLIGRKLATLERVAECARKFSGRALCYPVDLTRHEDIQELKRRIEEDFDHLDILIHSAGFIALGPVQTAPLADFDRQYQVNVRAPYALTQILLPMLRSCKGQVVFMNSSVWLNARGRVGQYAATKYALKAIADSLRDEVNADGLRVLSVFPGRTASPMQATVHEMEKRTYHPERLMRPEDVAAVVLHALSLPKSAEITDIKMRPLTKP